MMVRVIYESGLTVVHGAFILDKTSNEHINIIKMKHSRYSKNRLIVDLEC